jgi:hypothetical protein
MRRYALALLAAAMFSGTAEADLLADGFRMPPATAKPRVWWHWMNGNISRDGIAKDIAWMRRVGIGGMTLFDGNLDTPKLVAHPVAFMSPEWKADVAFAAKEAAAAGLELSISTSDGWSLTGGPSVSPPRAMSKIVWSRTTVEGGRPITVALPHPPTVSGPFQDYPNLEYFGNAFSTKPVVPAFYTDTRVIAYRLPAGTTTLPTPMIALDGGALDASRLSDGKFAVAQAVGADAKGRAVLSIRFAAVQTVRAITIGVIGPFPRGHLDISDGNGTPERIADIDTLPDGDVFGSLPARTISFAHPVTAATFELTIEPPKRADTPPTTYQLSELRLESEPRVHRFEAKAAFDSLKNYAAAATPAQAADTAIATADVLDISGHMRADGTLRWNAPPGRWDILRFGSSLTGHRNSPSTPDGEGLEVDKLDATAVGTYLDGYFSPILKAVGPYRGAHGLQAILNDSYEAGQQNWTPDMVAQFKARRGYDPIPWFPVLAGRVVRSADASDRFLADYRQTIVDLFADAHYRSIVEFAHAHGLKAYAESAAGFSPMAANEIRNRAHADYPMGEFWDGPPDDRLIADMIGAASAAHVYGHPVVAAESFTFAPRPDAPPFSPTPASLKPKVDRAFALGINRVVIHTSVHQATEQAPGLTLGNYGQYFTRHETWADLAAGWTAYLARSSYLLQQGQPVRDVLSFLGEGVKVVPVPDDPAVPAGFRADYIDEDGLLGRVSVGQGRLVTPSGMSYRLLALPPGEHRYSLALLTKIRALVRDGAIVTGPKPVGVSGLGDSDVAGRALVDQLWGDGTAPHAFGTGTILPGPVAEGLEALHVAPDLGDPSSALVYEHRRTKDADIYFVANPSGRAVDATAEFRVVKRDVATWNAETGIIVPSDYRIEKDRTMVPLKLASGDAIFIVFRGLAPRGRREGSSNAERILATIDGPWEASFESKRGAPTRFVFPHLQSWSLSTNAGVRYYSGVATYRRHMIIPKQWRLSGRRLYLDLGAVGHIARVSVNGQAAGTTWRAPYRIDITDSVRAGPNQLTIEVANTWLNRIVGDKQPGAQRYSFTTASTDAVKADTPLPPSGLIGPVRLIGTDETR